MKRILVGLDLNGRADFAARDQMPDDPDLVLESPLIIRGGLNSVVVLTKDVRRVAGPQAEVAPHGRGRGWGELGATERRRFLARAVDLPDDSATEADVRAAIDALARGADELMLTVPDLAEFDEVRQGALLRIASDRRRRVRLLWRPVAVFLDLLAAGEIPVEAVGDAFRILVHGPRGLEDQTLVLAADPDHGSHRAPRRDGPGSLGWPELGLDAMFTAAQNAVRTANSSVNWDRCEDTRLGPRLLAGYVQPGEVEVLRTSNGSWTSAVAPPVGLSELIPDVVMLSGPRQSVVRTFVVTPLEDQLAHQLCSLLHPALGEAVPVHSDCVARGALRAGRLIERGLPHYYDRLERIAIAVLRNKEPVFADLIPEGEVVPANREYISRSLDGFQWARDKTNVEFYILKGDNEVRHWEARKEQGPDRPVPVVLRVRQTPGQSWARLTVTSEAWGALARAPISLDWETIAPQDLSPEDVLKRLRSPPPVIPNRLVERPHAALWLGGDLAGRGIASKLADQALLGGPILAAEWATVLRQSRRDPAAPMDRLWHIGTDGDLPNDLPEEVREGFQIALDRLEVLLTSPRPQPDNAALIAATWCFAACPQLVQDRIVAALEVHARGGDHPLLRPRFAAKVLRNGAGRAVTGVERLRRVLKLYAASNLNNDTINGLAMLMSRRSEAADALDRLLVDHFAAALGRELLLQVESRHFSIKFRNTLSAIAGLFRWRKREPYALLATDDIVASGLRQTLERARQLMASPTYNYVRQREVKLTLIESIIALLDGSGDPDILRQIEADDVDDNEDES